MVSRKFGRVIALTAVRLLVFALIILVGTSCGYRKNAMLFKTSQKIKKTGLPLYRQNADTTVSAEGPYQHIVQPDDRISVRFLNNYDVNEGVMLSGMGDAEVSFLVSDDSTVTLPTVGMVKVAGMTRDSIARKLEQLYSEQMYANIEVLPVGLSVTILGEVKAPGVYELSKERTTLVELIGKAGSITQYGKPQRVFIYRKKADGDYEIFLFDMTRIEVLALDETIVKDKDIIYVQPRKIKLFADVLAPYANLLGIAVSISALVIAFGRI